jgi:hypothetical protein
VMLEFMTATTQDLSETAAVGAVFAVVTLMPHRA